MKNWMSANVLFGKKSTGSSQLSSPAEHQQHSENSNPTSCEASFLELSLWLASLDQHPICGQDTQNYTQYGDVLKNEELLYLEIS